MPRVRCALRLRPLAWPQALLQPFARDNVRGSEDEKHDRDDDVERIHGGSY
jgi:hypothetical protein